MNHLFSGPIFFVRVTVLGRFIQCNIKTFLRRSTMVADIFSQTTTKLSRFDGNATFLEHAIILSKSLKYLLSCSQWSFLENISDKLDCLNNLEIVLIAKRLVFNTIVIMPEAQTLKFHGSIETTPVDVSEMCNQLTREGKC